MEKEQSSQQALQEKRHQTISESSTLDTGMKR